MDPALYGNCLSCGKRVYATDYCDKCLEWSEHTCQECGETHMEVDSPVDYCVQHMTDMESIREAAFDALECRDKMARELLDHKKVIEELQKGLAELRRM